MGPALALCLCLCLVVQAEEPAAFEVVDRAGVSYGLVTREVHRTATKTLLEEQVLWRGAAAEIHLSEELLGDQRKIVWRELSQGRVPGRTWLLECRGDGRWRSEFLGSTTRPVEWLEPKRPVIGPLHLIDLLRAGVLPEEELALVDPLAAALIEIRVRRVEPDALDLLTLDGGKGEVRVFEWKDGAGKVVRRLVFQGEKLVAEARQGCPAPARRISAQKARDLERRLRVARTERTL